MFTLLLIILNVFARLLLLPFLIYYWPINTLLNWLHSHISLLPRILYELVLFLSLPGWIVFWGYCRIVEPFYRFVYSSWTFSTVKKKSSICFPREEKTVVVPVNSNAVKLVFGDIAFDSKYIELETLKKHSITTIQRTEKILDESMTLVATTSNCHTFFERLDLANDMLLDLCDLEDYIDFESYSPFKELQNFDNLRTFFIEQFLDRHYDATLKKIHTFKKRATALQDAEDYLTELTFYSDQMPDKLILKYSNMYRKMKDEIESSPLFY